ncbi:hypothetical protein TIFTF001_012982 [Ficus carica]|uniref:Uncharacterized protein n=1 Tax=Ficus carica TaxID=3494 RepID=A0AA88A007_FICCA|nr:hypothetical protein TIFTF001_012982 [Ficus carica]
MKKSVVTRNKALRIMYLEILAVLELGPGLAVAAAEEEEDGDGEEEELGLGVDRKTNCLQYKY